MSLVLKLIKDIKVTEKDITSELSEICEREHSSCNSDCPVYELNGHEAPDTEENNRGCDCFKNGDKMLAFIRKN